MSRLLLGVVALCVMIVAASAQSSEAPEVISSSTNTDSTVTVVTQTSQTTFTVPETTTGGAEASIATSCLTLTVTSAAAYLLRRAI